MDERFTGERLPVFGRSFAAHSEWLVQAELFANNVEITGASIPNRTLLGPIRTS